MVCYPFHISLDQEPFNASTLGVQPQQKAGRSLCKRADLSKKQVE
jgi:hypothetical protein